MEFETLINRNKYTLSFINATTVLVSCTDSEYILYKRKFWHCADEIPDMLMKELASVLDQHLTRKSLA